MVVCVSNSRPRWRELIAFSRNGSRSRDRRADDAAQPLLLLRRRVHLDREMAHHPVGAIFDGGRIECLAPAMLPRRAEALAERAGDEGRHSDGGDDEEDENDPARAARQRRAIVAGRWNASGLGGGHGLLLRLHAGRHCPMAAT